LRTGKTASKHQYGTDAAQNIVTFH